MSFTCCKCKEKKNKPKFKHKGGIYCLPCIRKVDNRRRDGGKKTQRELEKKRDASES